MTISAAQGFRVLAVAYAAVPAKQAHSIADEHSLTLAGYMAFGDPARIDAAESIAALQRDGVEIKIITGDSDLVSGRICEQEDFSREKSYRG